MINLPLVMIMKQQIKGTFLLLFATLIWGSAFVAQSLGMDYVGPFTFQALRCGIGAVALLPIIYLFDRKEGHGKEFYKRFTDKTLWKAAISCAIPLFFATNLQQMGLVTVDAGKSGFLTAMYIVFVPVFRIFQKQKPSPMVPISVVIAVVGLYFLSCMGVTSISAGDLLLLACAVAFALQILFVDKYVDRVDGLRLNCLQAAICSVGSFVVMFFTEMPTIEGIQGSFWALCYAGVLSMGIAYSLQILGQKHLEPTLASLVMSLESVIAVLCGAIFLHERMTSWEILGCVLVFIAVILSQIPYKEKSKE